MFLLSPTDTVNEFLFMLCRVSKRLDVDDQSANGMFGFSFDVMCIFYC